MSDHDDTGPRLPHAVTCPADNADDCRCPISNGEVLAALSSVADALDAANAAAPTHVMVDDPDGFLDTDDGKAVRRYLAGDNLQRSGVCDVMACGRIRHVGIVLDPGLWTKGASASPNRRNTVPRCFFHWNGVEARQSCWPERPHNFKVGACTRCLLPRPELDPLEIVTARVTTPACSIGHPKGTTVVQDFQPRAQP